MPPADYILRLQEAIREIHRCESRHVGSTPVVEESGDRILWQGEVETFMLLGHPAAKRCYAWTHGVNGAARTMAVLELAPVNGPFSAVKVALASAQRSPN
jgi:hypothetical protein